MKKVSSCPLHLSLALLLGMGALAPQNILAQNHVVSPSDMQKDVASASAARQQDQQRVTGFLSSQEAQQAMKSAKIDPQQVTTAVSQLNDADMARLAARADKAQKDFAAGTLSNHDLLLILVAIAALILLIVAVH
ncbi:MAG: hypothetical protein ACYDC6_04880 [Acidobacteriaceae bacterium]